VANCKIEVTGETPIKVDTKPMNVIELACSVAKNDTDDAMLTYFMGLNLRHSRDFKQS